MEKVLVIVLADKKSHTYKALNVIEEVVESSILGQEPTSVTKIDNYIVDLQFANDVNTINKLIHDSELNYFCIIPDNVFLSSFWLSDLVVAYNSVSLNSGVVGIINDFKDKEFSSVFCNYNDDFPSDVVLSDYIDGVMLFHRWAIDSIGYFDSSIKNYLKHFCIRLNIFGANNFYISDKTSIYFQEEVDETDIESALNSMMNNNCYIHFSTN